MRLPERPQDRLTAFHIIVELETLIELAATVKPDLLWVVEADVRRELRRLHLSLSNAQGLAPVEEVMPAVEEKLKSSWRIVDTQCEQPA